MFLQDHVLHGTQRLPYESPATMQARLTPKRGVIKLAAEVDGQLVGYAELIIHPDNRRHRHAGEVNMIVTREA